ncbi:MAG: heme-copper oxidase subunit III [Deltaproteobacteria bacterium]|nr:heme-copper oxidase subunit III [Deltaproteobacteria bacterium]MBW2418629.1 heme-copper oxidase subunit III [Deltaproteobacteria bacterium]
MSGQNVIPLQTNRRTRSAVVEDGTIGMLAFVFVEAMMFAGLMSAFVIARATAGGAWPPAGQPRLPFEETAINTVALLASGAVVFLASRTWEKQGTRTGPLLLAAIGLGAFFVFFQGIEWIALIRQGLTLTSSQHGSFFYLIVGMHGAHALGALVFMGVAWLRLQQGTLSNSAFSAARVLWYFVVAVWPVLYFTLYL